MASAVLQTTRRIPNAALRVNSLCRTYGVSYCKAARTMFKEIFMPNFIRFYYVIHFLWLLSPVSRLIVPLNLPFTKHCEHLIAIRYSFDC